MAGGLRNPPGVERGRTALRWPAGFRATRSPRTPGAFDEREWLGRQGVHEVLSAAVVASGWDGAAGCWRRSTGWGGARAARSAGAGSDDAGRVVQGRALGGTRSARPDAHTSSAALRAPAPPGRVGREHRVARRGRPRRLARGVCPDRWRRAVRAGRDPLRGRSSAAGRRSCARPPRSLLLDRVARWGVGARALAPVALAVAAVPALDP